MTSLGLENDGDAVMVVLTQADYTPNQDEDEAEAEDQVMISTDDVYSWNFPSILQHRIIKVKAQRITLIEHSSYFHGLLGGNFCDSDLEILVQWNQPTFLSLLASLFGSPVDVTSENFLSLFEGALYFGMETILSKCKLWLAKAILVNGVTLVQLNDLIRIWKFGSELVNNYLPEVCTTYLAKNFIWATSCSSFCDVPYELLLSSTKHPHLTVDREKQLCDTLLVWISANNERCMEYLCINLLKQIRASLLPLWFAAGKHTSQSLSMCSKESFCGDMDVVEDRDLLNLRIRLTDFTQRVDLSGCSLINPEILLLSTLPSPVNLEPHLRKRVKKLIMNYEHINVFPLKMWPNLTFKAIHEIDISNCPMLPLETAIKIFSKSFPCLRILKAANHLSFKTSKVLQLVKCCPLLCDIDLTVGVSPVLPIRVPTLSLFPAFTPASSSVSLFRPLPSASNITKLTLEGRFEVTDFDLWSISDICISLTYINLKGCILVSDGCISALISKCLELNSIVACDTFFGQQSVLALCSPNSGKNIPQGCNLQMLHIGGCKAYVSSKHAEESLRDTEVVDDVLFSFFGSSLEVLDVSNSKASSAGVAHVIGRNPGLKCLKTKACEKLLQNKGGNFPCKNLFSKVRRSCKLNEISVGCGFSYSSLKAMKHAVSSLKAIEVGLCGSLGQDGLKWLPADCPLLESVILCFQVISDDLIVNMLESLKHLRSFGLCHCRGEITSSSLKVSMPNLRKLRLEKVAPWMKNADLVNLTHNCPNLIELSLLGCPLLNSESQKIISSGWPGLISIHLEECGKVTKNGVVSLFDCRALEDILLLHNGSGIQKGFIGEAVSKLPMLRKMSLDICDAIDKDFDIPLVEDWKFSRHVNIKRCIFPR